MKSRDTWRIHIMTSRPLSVRSPMSAIGLLGALLVVLGFITYPLIAAWNSTKTVVGESLLINYAYFILGLDTVGLCLLFYGATNVLTYWSTSRASGKPTSTAGMLAAAFAGSRHPRLLLASSFAYGTIYAFASRTIVFQPALDFSSLYHVGIPSLAVATCCGPIGETPQLAMLVTRQLGLILVPLNLLLLFSLSWLVGLNASFASFALSFRRKNMGIGWVGGFGAFIGLFTSCPTCGGLAIISLLGGTGTLSASFFLGPLQTVLVLVSIPTLAATPMVTARWLRSLEAQACVLSSC
jgi:hypothetical protein